jgi:metallophosphoesterase (TIGR00282 family)
MRILFCGDVMARSGREILEKYVPQLRQRFDLDCVIVNGENAASGFGITQAICRAFYKLGVDVITTGNHVWDQREIIGVIDNEKRLLRPLNYPASTPGQGYYIHQTTKGQSVLVMNAMARLFMETLDNPFVAVDEVLKKYSMPHNVDAIVLDFHGEATSEKMVMGHYCDGRVSLVAGTHTHVPTSDYRILNGGTAYQSDVGMCGDYDSVIGMNKEKPIFRFSRNMPTERPLPAGGEATLCGLLISTDDTTGLAKKIFPLRLGGCLPQTNLDKIILE